MFHLGITLIDGKYYSLPHKPKKMSILADAQNWRRYMKAVSGVSVPLSPQYQQAPCQSGLMLIRKE
jgi:hypothetical protein